MIKFLFDVVNRRLSYDLFMGVVVSFYKFFNRSIEVKDGDHVIFKDMGKLRKLKGKGDRYRVFIAVKNVNWEKVGLVDTWRNVAEVIWYDWGSDFNQYSHDWYGKKKDLFNKSLFQKVKQANERKKIDMFFSYLSGRWLEKETIIKIRDLGILTVNISFDDSHRFWGKLEKDGWTGMATIAKYYDLNITCQDKQDLIKYSFYRCNALFMPPGVNTHVWGKYLNLEKTFAVSFVGQKYGKREKIIEYLKDKGIKIVVRGKGWEKGPLSFEDMVRIYSRSFISLGIGYVGSSGKTAIKVRDFEVPCTGTLYITSWNSLLSEYLNEREEIVFYKSKKDLVNKIMYFLNHKEEALRIGDNARKRIFNDHPWEKRWVWLLEFLS